MSEQITEEEKALMKLQAQVNILHCYSSNLTFIVLKDYILYFSYQTLIGVFNRKTNMIYLNAHRYSKATDNHMYRIKEVYKTLQEDVKTRIIEYSLEDFITILKCIDILPFLDEDYLRNGQLKTKENTFECVKCGNLIPHDEFKFVIGSKFYCRQCKGSMNEFKDL